MSVDRTPWSTYYWYLENSFKRGTLSREDYTRMLASARQAELDGKNPQDWLMQQRGNALQHPTHEKIEVPSSLKNTNYEAVLRTMLVDRMQNKNYSSYTDSYFSYSSQQTNKSFKQTNKKSSAKKIAQQVSRPRSKNRLRKFMGLPYKP